MEGTGEVSEQQDAARWLRRNGFTTGEDHRVSYQLETGQLVRLTPENEERWRAHLNRRWAAAFPGFRFTLPTAATMTARHSPEGRAAALAEKQRQERQRQIDMASVLGMAFGRYLR